MSEVTPLSVRQKMMLNAERHWWKYQGAKDADIMHQFGCNPTRYYLELNALLDHPGALVYEPQTVRRLIRLRETRREQRSARRLAG